MKTQESKTKRKTKNEPQAFIRSARHGDANEHIQFSQMSFARIIAIGFSSSLSPVFLSRCFNTYHLNFCTAAFTCPATFLSLQLHTCGRTAKHIHVHNLTGGCTRKYTDLELSIHPRVYSLYFSPKSSNLFPMQYLVHIQIQSLICMWTFYPCPSRLHHTITYLK